MNRKKLLKIVGVLIGLMILFPPVVTTHMSTRFRNTIESTTNDYAFLLSLPANSTLNASTLMIQIIGALIIGGIAYVSLGKDE